MHSECKRANVIIAIPYIVLARPLAGLPEGVTTQLININLAMIIGIFIDKEV